MSPDIDSICDEFEKHWKDRTPPPIEDFLEGVESDLVSDLLWELIQIELWWRHQQSRLPSLESFQERFSNHQDAVIRAFDAFHTRTLGQQGQVDASPKLFPSMGDPNDGLDAKLAAAEDAADDGNESYEQDPKAPDAKGDGKPGAVEADAASEKNSVGIGDRVRYFGQYELIEEIARGGMGVVYKARQIKLNRLVALKMILSGQLAGDEEVQRFKSEAEAAANLDHSGIVPIYEIGEHKGQHYFSMGFVEGQSLSDRIKANDGPLPPREAAELVKKVAEAIAYAHDQGVIHRDLKPANVLLDARGEPKVTDFGLAKQVESDSDLTRSGAVLGTPAFMPPEQAKGELDKVGPLADVYSLGAILYQLLTGGPPFQSANAMDILMQVIEKEPVSVTQLSPSVSRDLETICMKCLRKETSERYASADELADDLQRWLRDEPIHARPVGQVERTWKWCRRHPQLVATVSASIAVMFVGVLVMQNIRNAAEGKRLAQGLLQADTTQIKATLNELSGYEQYAVGDLQAAFEESEEGSNAKLHAALAMLPNDPSYLPFLKERLLTVSPAQFASVRDELGRMEDHRKELTEHCWAVALDLEQPEDRRFQAACALATYDSSNESWRDPEFTVFISEQLVNVLPSALQPWRDSLRPLREHLSPALGKIYRDKGLREQVRNFAAETLGDYLQNDCEALFELLMDANEHQFVAIADQFQKYGDQSVSMLQNEIRRGLRHEWNDPPLGGNSAPPTDEVKVKIERANGMIAERFAFVQTLPLEEYLLVAHELAKLGYRPTRLRPYAHHDSVQVASVWNRDGREWRFEDGDSQASILAVDELMRSDGFVAVDVAGFIRATDGPPIEQYAGIWVKQQSEKEDARIYAGVSFDRHLEAHGELKQAGFKAQNVLQAFRGLDGKQKYCGVKMKAGNKWYGSWDYEESKIKNKHSDKIHVDLDVSQSDKTMASQGPGAASVTDPKVELRYSAVWLPNNEYETVELYGLSPEEHLAHSRELTAAEYRLISITATTLGTEKTTASVWHRPVIAEEAKEKLALRQANAAVMLLRLGAADAVWPLLKHSEDPRVRSYIIHWLSPRGGNVKTILARYDEEEDVTIKRALLLCLGEFDLQNELKQPFTEKLLEVYKNDPDAGLHAAAQWLLKQWEVPLPELPAGEPNPERSAGNRACVGYCNGERAQTADCGFTGTTGSGDCRTATGVGEGSYRRT